MDKSDLEMVNFFAFLIFLFMIPVASAVCTVPAENFEARESIVLCYGTYNIEGGIKILAENISVDCNNSILIGNGIGYGILIEGKNKAAVQNCNISNYEIGIYLDNANESIVKNNYLAKNKFGIALFNSFNNGIGHNILAGNAASNAIVYFTASPIGKENAKIQEEKLPTPWGIMEEAIKIKKPSLSSDEIKDEVDSILGRYLGTSKENLEITRTISYNEREGSTTIILNLNPKKILSNVSIYEKIPKCVSAYVNQILFETGGYEVIQDDPLVMWAFSRLDDEKKITYRVLRSIDEGCKNLLFAFGIASGFEEFEKMEIKKEKNKNYMFAAVIAALLAIAAFYLIKKRSP